MQNILSKIQNTFVKSNKTSDSKTQMQNILSKVQNIFDTGMYPVIYSVVFDIIKILADNINYRNNKALLSNTPKENVWEDTFTNMVFKVDEIKIEKEIIIHMGKNPVLSDIWSEHKQIDGLKNFSEYARIWKEDRLNHFYYLILPVGLTVVVNGFHSTNAGIVKSIGHLCFSPNTENGKVFDISSLYQNFFFDGIYYREMETKKIISGLENEKGKSIFELGCIYEIGRIIHNEAQKGHIIQFPYVL